MNRYMKDAQAMHVLGMEIGQDMLVGDVVKLYGELGTGKTTIARGILQGLGHDGEVPSPSFPIVQYYSPPDVRIPLVHADFYRIEDTEELYELGLDDAGCDGAIIAEWPEKGTPVLPDNALAIHIGFAAKGGRNIAINDTRTGRAD